MRPSLLHLKSLTKAYAGVPALRQVTLELAAGEILGLIGENGAGKSTLIKLLSGVILPDGGQIEWLGAPVQFRSPHDALAAGIATIHQELAFFGQLTVAENLLLGEPWPRRRWGSVDWPKLYGEAARVLEEFHIRGAPTQLAHELSAAQRQELAIARALSKKARLIILDEPTASLSEPEVDQLLAHLARLRETGVAMIYVSHRLDEVLRLTDRVAVLRDGALVAAYRTSECTAGQLVREMVGRPLDQVFPHTRHTPGPVLLELEGATRSGMFHHVTLGLRAGEILGLAGLVGSGRSELARAIFGLYPLHAGSMRLDRQPWHPPNPKAAMEAGLVYVPEERKRQGFVLDHSVSDSVSIGFSDLLARWGIVRSSLEKRRVTEVLKAHTVRARSPLQAIGTLSGGNQQKSLLGRWLERHPRVMILDEPTRGVDVAAKAEIHALIDRLAGEGKAVLLISSDLQEVVGMSDRLVVMHRGKLVAELAGASLTQENVILAASGLGGASGQGGHTS